jgi:hypothetical protein
MVDVARLRTLLSEQTRLQWIATSVIASVVTLVVAVPLTIRAFDARNDDRPRTAPADGIVATLGATTGDLEGSTLSDAPVITFDLDDTGATAFRLVDVTSNELLAGTDSLGPEFAMFNTPEGFPAAFDTTDFPDGGYTIYVTFTLVDPVDQSSSETYRMANFAIRNES